MNSFYEFILEDLDLRNKIILDAAVGAGESTYFWAKRIDEQGGTSKIISVDNYLPKSCREEIKKRLGKYSKYVELKEGDIFDLSFLESESIDIINCNDTIVFLNSKPLKLLFAFNEFARVLKPGGHLIITSESPVDSNKTETEGQWRRWNFAKAIYNLKEKTWATEPEPEEVKFALKLLGMKVYAEKTFPEHKMSHYQDSISEWKEIMEKDIKGLPWDDSFKKSLEKQVRKIYKKIKKDGYLMCPPLWVIKCRKGNQDALDR